MDQGIGHVMDTPTRSFPAQSHITPMYAMKKRLEFLCGLSWALMIHLLARSTALAAQVEQGKYPGGKLNQRRIDAVEDAIRHIEAAIQHPELRRIAPSLGGEKRKLE
jgi:hypothetical protein